jgi:hypothetical protein
MLCITNHSRHAAWWSAWRRRVDRVTVAAGGWRQGHGRALTPAGGAARCAAGATARGPSVRSVASKAARCDGAPTHREGSTFGANAIIRRRETALMTSCRGWRLVCRLGVMSYAPPRRSYAPLRPDGFAATAQLHKLQYQSTKGYCTVGNANVFRRRLSLWPAQTLPCPLSRSWRLRRCKPVPIYVRPVPA